MEDIWTAIRLDSSFFLWGFETPFFIKFFLSDKLGGSRWTCLSWWRCSCLCSWNLSRKSGRCRRERSGGSYQCFQSSQLIFDTIPISGADRLHFIGFWGQQSRRRNFVRQSHWAKAALISVSCSSTLSMTEETSRWIGRSHCGEYSYLLS